MDAHPAAEIFPMLSSLDMANLVGSIQREGQKHPIIVHEGKILDGRNRFRACKLAGIKPWIEQWDGKGSPVEYVLACNLHRRHLDDNQRAMVAARVANLAKPGRPKIGAIAPISTAKSAEMLNVSTDSVKRAKAVVNDGDPELVSAVDRGDVSVSAAAAVARKPVDEQREVLKRGPAAVVAEARAVRTKDNTDELYNELVKLWKKAGNRTRQRFMEYVEGLR